MIRSSGAGTRFTLSSKSRLSKKNNSAGASLTQGLSLKSPKLPNQIYKKGDARAMIYFAPPTRPRTVKDSLFSPLIFDNFISVTDRNGRLIDKDI